MTTARYNRLRLVTLWILSAQSKPMYQCTLALYTQLLVDGEETVMGVHAMAEVLDDLKRKRVIVTQSKEDTRLSLSAQAVTI